MLQHHCTYPCYVETELPNVHYNPGNVPVSAVFVGRSTSLLSFDYDEAMVTFFSCQQKESWPRKRARKRALQSNKCEILVLGLPTAQISASKHGAKARIVDIAVVTAMMIARKRKQRMHPARAG
jgi:hypothetical protein